MKRNVNKTPKARKSKWQQNNFEAYQAAVMVTKGMSTGQIAAKLFGSKSNACLNRVGSLLKLAESAGVFTLAGQLDHETSSDLKLWCENPKMEFFVVKNDRMAYTGNPAVDEALGADAIARKAAEVVAQRIAELLILHRHHKNRVINIANAGGFAVSRIVHFLASHRLLPEETNARRLRFISLNSASMPTDYGRSANTLAVRMAEIYGGRHIALCSIFPPKTVQEYEEAVNNIDLLLCGAGSRKSLLFTWLQENADITVPANAVGDICLFPIDENGEEVAFKEPSLTNLRTRLNLHPTYSEIHTLAGNNKVIFVPMGYGSEDTGSDAAGSATEHSKLAVTRAILKNSLAHTCILGNTLARALIYADVPTA